MTKTLVLGDIHAPYHHRRALEWVYRLADKMKPDRVVQVGDLRDQFSFSRYPKVLKMSPEKEMELASAAVSKIWAHFKGLSNFQLVGNHDDRLLKKVLSDSPELASLVGKSFREMYTFPGVTTVYDSRQELILDGVIYQHGHRSKLGDHARFNQRSTVCGHSHNGGVVFMRNLKGVYWELNAGYLGDVRSPAFGYHSQKRMHTCTLGVGLIDEHGPRFIPYDR
ncbi:MAG: metallophosphoesterase [Archangiaceae bacterium]|nr:metallophosphoesterase [Archangiaceae bacterium]